MPPKKDYSVYSQIQNSINETIEKNKKKVPLNPTKSTPTALFAPAKTSLGQNTSVKNYSWAHRSFNVNDNGERIRLSPLSFEAAISVYNRELQSPDGNLTVFGVENNKVHAYSATIFKRTGGGTSFSINWDNDISIYVNDSLVASNYGRDRSLNEEIPIGLSSGWNTIDIYLHCLSGNNYFSINNPLSEYADQWTTPQYSSIPSVPYFSVERDTKNVGIKDGDANIIRWDSSDKKNTSNYSVFRRGPYNSGVASPVIIASEISGYYSANSSGFVPPSGLLNTRTYYTVSAVDLYGEGLSSLEEYGDLSPTFSGVTGVLATGYTHVDGVLETGVFSYTVIARSQIGGLFPTDSTIWPAFNSEDSVRITWNEVDNADFYDIYRISGYPPITDVLSNFSGYLISSVATGGSTEVIDTGIVVMTPTLLPDLNIARMVDPYGEQYAYKNNSIYISWSGVTSSASDVSYRIYKTSYSGVYKNKSLVGTTSNLYFIDSGSYDNGSLEPYNGMPILYQSIGRPGVDTKEFRDAGLIHGKTYDYSMSALSSSLNESPRTTGVNITAGDFTPPAVPSGVSIAVNSGIIVLEWENGGELDFAGSRIYTSGDGATGYNLIGQTITPYFETFAGFGTQNYYKISNFDTSNNESDLSDQVQSPVVSPQLPSDSYLTGLFVPKFGNYDIHDIKTFESYVIFKDNIYGSGTLEIGTTTSNSEIVLTASNGAQIHGNAGAVFINGGSSGVNINGSSGKVSIFGDSLGVDIFGEGGPVNIGGSQNLSLSGNNTSVRSTQILLLEANANDAILRANGSGDVIVYASSGGATIISGSPSSPGGIYLEGGEGGGSINTNNDFIPKNSGVDNIGSESNPYATGFFDSIVAPLSVDLKTSTYTIQRGDDVVLSSGNLSTVLLPSDPTNGDHYWIKNLDVTNVIVSGLTPLTLIDDQFYQPVSQYSALHVVYYSPKWHII